MECPPLGTEPRESSHGQAASGCVAMAPGPGCTVGGRGTLGAQAQPQKPLPLLCWEAQQVEHGSTCVSLSSRPKGLTPVEGSGGPRGWLGALPHSVARAQALRPRARWTQWRLGSLLSPCHAPARRVPAPESRWGEVVPRARAGSLTYRAVSAGRGGAHPPSGSSPGPAPSPAAAVVSSACKGVGLP